MVLGVGYESVFNDEKGEGKQEVMNLPEGGKQVDKMKKGKGMGKLVFIQKN